MADTPGDGTTNPFGDGAGQGGTGMGKGNNFLTNPGGGAGTKGGGQPESYGQSRTQTTGEDSDINPAEIPDGGKDLTVDPGPDEGNPVGTTAGAGRKPFRVS